MELTLAEAAKTAKRSKQALAAAIKSGKLSATKDANGVWLVDTAELFRVYPTASQAPNKPDQESGRCLVGLVGDESAELRDMRRRMEAAEARAEELRRDRDDWKEVAQRLTRALPAGSEPKPRRSFWSWLRGR